MSLAESIYDSLNTGMKYSGIGEIANVVTGYIVTEYAGVAKVRSKSGVYFPVINMTESSRGNVVLNSLVTFVEHYPQKGSNPFKTFRVRAGDSKDIIDCASCAGKAKNGDRLTIENIGRWLRVWDSDGDYTDLKTDDIIVHYIELEYGRFLICNTSGRVSLWSRSGSVVKEFVGHGDSVACALQMKNGTLVTCEKNGTFIYWM